VAVAFAGLAGAAVKPTLSVSPSTVHRGGKVTFSGAHWPKRVTVTLLLGYPNSEAAKFAGVKTTGTGRFTYTLPIKPTAPTGKYVVLACRNNCKTEVSKPLTIAP
jgi:hypothetical protein